MRTIKLTTGAPLTLDGDLLAVLEALYKEVSAKHELQSNFEDMSMIRSSDCDAISRPQRWQCGTPILAKSNRR